MLPNLLKLASQGNAIFGLYTANVVTWNTNRMERMQTKESKTKRTFASRPVTAGSLVIVFVLLAAGCAGGPQSEASLAPQRLLAGSGFKFKTADSPEQVADLKAMPQKTLFRRSDEGREWYVYADAKGCNCIYYGDEENFQRLQKLIRSEKQAYRTGIAVRSNQRSAVAQGIAPQVDWDRWEE
jgi:hypothetical protein